MGNLCTQNHNEILQRNLNIYNQTIISQFKINQAKIQLIVGSYRKHQSDLLLVFAQTDDLEYYPQIKDYVQNYLQLIETISTNSKHLIQVHTNSNCPYKRFVVAILPAYDSQQSESYYKYFQQLIRQILSTCSQITLQISPTAQNGKGIPNQTLIILFLKYLKTYEKHLKIYLISTQIRLLNMVRYEMAKLGTYVPLIQQIDDE